MDGPLSSCYLQPHRVSSVPAMCLCAGYRHVYLEGMEEASIFVHIAVNDITGKVGTTEEVGHHLCALPFTNCTGAVRLPASTKVGNSTQT